MRDPAGRKRSQPFRHRTSALRRCPGRPPLPVPRRRRTDPVPEAAGWIPGLPAVPAGPAPAPELQCCPRDRWPWKHRPGRSPHGRQDGNCAVPGTSRAQGGLLMPGRVGPARTGAAWTAEPAPPHARQIGRGRRGPLRWTFPLPLRALDPQRQGGRLPGTACGSEDQTPAVPQGAQPVFHPGRGPARIVRWPVPATGFSGHKPCGRGTGGGRWAGRADRPVAVRHFLIFGR